MVKARNEGIDIWNEGPEVLVKGGQVLPAAARGAGYLEDMTFDYASTDSVDYVPTPTPAF